MGRVGEFGSGWIYLGWSWIGEGHEFAVLKTDQEEKGRQIADRSNKAMREFPDLDL